MIPENYTQEINAVFNKDHYYHFNIHPATASMYGDKVEDIEALIIEAADDQSLPDDKNMATDYWGFYDFDKGKFTMVYPQRFLLNMCFPTGIKGSEEYGEGKAYRLNVTKK